MADQLIAGIAPVLDDQGNPVAGGSVEFYETGTTEFVDIFADVDGTIPLLNPLGLDAAGRPENQVFYTGSVAVKEVIKDADGVVLYTIDPSPRFSITSAAASGVTYAPTEDNPSLNVQDAVDFVSQRVAAGLPELGEPFQKLRVGQDGTATEYVPGFVMGTPTVFATAGSGTYNVPSGARALMVEACGGGGGGGGAGGANATARAGSGGGGGAFFKMLIVNPAASYPYTVGAAGAGAGVGSNNGSNGSDTTFGTAIAPAGLGGAASGTLTNAVVLGANTGLTGFPSGLATIIHRSRGYPGSYSSKISDSSRVAGSGGHSPYGTGGIGATLNAAPTISTGASASGNGAGGAGGAGGNEGTGAAGGDGTPGILIITPMY